MPPLKLARAFDPADRHAPHTTDRRQFWIDEKALGVPTRMFYCSEDESAPGSTSTAYTVSPKHLKALTLVRPAEGRSPASRNVAVAGKDRAAVMMGGRNLDQRWYWDGKTFVTDLKGVAVPRTEYPQTRPSRDGRCRSPPLDPPALCQAKSRAYQLTPALKVGDNHLERTAGDVRNFRGSPELDGATLALAADSSRR
jgi:hypothetical protein